MAEGHAPVPQPSKAAIRCVIWHSAALALPGELLSSLSKRIGHMSVSTDGYSAMAQLCAIERDRRATAAAGFPPSATSVLLLVYPRQLTEPAKVIEAARLYAPTCTIWQYDRAAGSSANPKLRAVVEEDMRSWSASSSLPPAPGGGDVTSKASDRGGALATRPSSLRPAPPPPTNGTPRQPTLLARPLTQLTEDELHMLLSDDPIPLPQSPPPQHRGGSR